MVFVIVESGALMREFYDATWMLMMMNSLLDATLSHELFVFVTNVIGLGVIRRYD